MHDYVAWVHDSDVWVHDSVVSEHDSDEQYLSYLSMGVSVQYYLLCINLA